MPVLKLDAAVYRVNKTIYIGSMRVVGARHFAVVAALSALYRKLTDLLVVDALKKDLVAPAANVVEFPLSYEDWTNEVLLKYRPLGEFEN